METVQAASESAEQCSSEPVASPAPRRTPNRITVLEPPAPKPDKFNKWLLVVALAVAAVSAALFVIVAEDSDTSTPMTDTARRLASEPEQQHTPGPPGAGDSELPESVRKQLAEAAKIRREVERLKQLELEHQRTLEQAEELQRERDAALAKARAEEEQRVREAERAKRAVEREQAAAAALAAEKAEQAERKAKALAEKKRLADQKRKQEQLKLEQAAREQEKLRLEQQAHEQEQLRLGQEARQREQEEAQRLARERDQQAERERVAAEQARMAKAEKEQNTGFSADPCSGPSARFVSSCRK